jgi:hypothetical protein
MTDAGGADLDQRLLVAGLRDRQVADVELSFFETGGLHADSFAVSSTRSR